MTHLQISQLFLAIALAMPFVALVALAVGTYLEKRNG